MISLRAYAKRRGVSAMSVSLAVKTGRLRKSVGRAENGDPKIADPDLADQEWDQNTDYTDAPMSVVAKASGSPGPAPAEEGDSLLEANRREKWAKAIKAETELATLRGELVPAAAVASKLEDTFTRCKTKLLGVPSRMKQAHPELTLAELTTLETVIREALEELASGA